MKGATLRFGNDVSTVEEQNERGSRLANGLRALGLAEGDAVAVLMKNGMQYVDVIRACRIAGIYYVPINWHFMAPEISTILQESKAKALIGHGELLDAVGSDLPTSIALLSVGPSIISGARDYESWLVRQELYLGPKVSPRAHMAFTSGTSGRPKGVLRQPVPLVQVEAQQQKMAEVVRLTLGIEPGARVLIPAPLYHSAVSILMQQTLLIAESVVLMERFDAEAVLRAIEQYRITTVYLVPIMYVRLLKLPDQLRDKYDLSSLKFVASTGAPCAPAVKQAMIQWFGPVINETYASSEAGMVTTIDSFQATLKPGSAGLPVGDAIVRIYNAYGTPAAPREIGKIYVRQPTYPDFTYLNNATGRAEIERDGLITLGDVGYMDEEGYLFVCDRESDMVISGGVNIYPAEIEHRMMAFPGVADCAVFGIPDDEFGERLHSIVEELPGQPLDVTKLSEWLRDGLASYKVPRTIEVGALPRDDNGKIAKRKLRDQHWQGQSRRI
ncbi:long-chain fatty acid--CoA ligase [Pseudomonas sp. WN033]|nr:long-chain fatty acid--CoA ligase [Pseudomonas sp. WN033]